jgi:hypothetical protein
MMPIKNRQIAFGLIMLASALLVMIFITQMFDLFTSGKTGSTDQNNPSSVPNLQDYLNDLGDDKPIFAIIPGESKIWFVRDENLIDEPYNSEVGSRLIRGYIQFSPEDHNSFALTPIQIDVRGLLDEQGLRSIVVSQVLNIEQYPFMLFTPHTIGEIERGSTGEEFELEIEGEMTIRDITNPVTLLVGGSLVSTDELRLEIVGEIVLADFGIEPPDLPFLGTDVEKGWMRAELLAIRGETPVSEIAESAVPTAGPQATGVIIHDPKASDGYTLVAPMFSNFNYLIDQNGDVVHRWESEYPAFAAYLLEDGSLLRSAFIGGNAIASRFGRGHGSTGRVERLDLDGQVSWFFEYSTDQYLLHHDIELLPNGNILMSAWEVVSKEVVINLGRDPTTVDAELWMDMLIEVDHEGFIVWEWHIFDHLIQDLDPALPGFGEIAKHPELIDINAGRDWTRDWTHVNAVDYDPLLDQILISVMGFNEFWIIDHSTTSEEAASHIGGNYGAGGDLLYRWGNPQSYGAGDQDDQKLFGFHDANWITPSVPGEGNILLFNNGSNRPNGNYSSVDEVALPVSVTGEYLLLMDSDDERKQVVWSYTSEDRSDFYAPNISGAQRLANGNTFITSGPSGELFEISPEGQILWWYVSPFGGSMESGSTQYAGYDTSENRGPGDRIVTSIFRALRYPKNHPGVARIVNQQ